MSNRRATAPEIGGWFLEDFPAGYSYATMRRTITEYDVRAFVSLGGFFEELFITSAKPLSESLGKSALVPGHLTLILAEGLCVLTGRLHNGVGLMELSDVKWVAPVACGDTIRCHVEVVEARPMSGRVDRGIVTTHHRVLANDEVEVLTYRKVMLVKSREELEP